MHIVYISKEFPPSIRSGGIGSYVQEISKGMVALGHKATVITASDDTTHESITEENGVTVMRLSGGDFMIPSQERGCILKKLRSLYRYHSYRTKLINVIESLGDVDIIEVPEFGAEGLYLNKLDIPYIVRLHTPSFLNRKTLKRDKTPFWKIHRYKKPIDEASIISNAKYISSCSDSLLEWVKKEVGIDPAITETIYNPIGNLNKANAIQLKDSENEYFTIFFAGTLVPQKGILELIKACRILKNEGLNIRLLLAGKESVYAQKIREEMKANSEDWCILLGKLDREELTKYYASADICCFPSWWDNMPMVCLESMRVGGLVLGSTSGGMKEIITDGENGFLTDPHNASGIVAQIKKIMSLSDSKKEQICLNAIDTIQNNFSSTVISTKMLEFYRKVIEDYKTTKGKR